MSGNTVLPKPTRLTELAYRQLVAAGVRRCSAKDGAGRFGLEVGCGEQTMRAARDARSSLNGSTLFNMLLADPTALDELAAYFGMQFVPRQPVEESDARLLADVTGLGAVIADALADGFVDHREEQRIAAAARPVVRELAGRIAVADRKRVTG